MVSSPRTRREPPVGKIIDSRPVAYEPSRRSVLARCLMWLTGGLAISSKIHASVPAAQKWRCHPQSRPATLSLTLSDAMHRGSRIEELRAGRAAHTPKQPRKTCQLVSPHTCCTALQKHKPLAGKCTITHMFKFTLIPTANHPVRSIRDLTHSTRLSPFSCVSMVDRNKHFWCLSKSLNRLSKCLKIRQRLSKCLMVCLI